MQNYENEVAELKPKEQYTYLKKYLHCFDNTKAQVKLYTTLVMQHPLATGVQKVRCFPFEYHKFQGRTIKDTVFLRPLSAQEFKLPENKQDLEYGRVQLLFQIRLPGKLGRSRLVECAFIKYYGKYEVEGSAVYNDERACMLYVCCNCVYIVCIQLTSLLVEQKTTSYTTRDTQGYMSRKSGSMCCQFITCLVDFHSFQTLEPELFPTSMQGSGPSASAREKQTPFTKLVMAASFTMSITLQ
jgi:hypothetical protein